MFPGLGDPFGLDIEAFNRFAIEALRASRPKAGQQAGPFDHRAYVEAQMRQRNG